jgi:uncharacterized delta-60 repeat protein
LARAGTAFNDVRLHHRCWSRPTEEDKMIVCNGALSATLERRLLVAGVVVVLTLSASSINAFDADLDDSFSNDGKLAFAMYAADSAANAVAVQPDRKIVVAGSSYNGSDFDFAVVRLTPQGDLDSTFNGDGKAFFDFVVGDDFAGDVVIQPDGKIVAVGVAEIAGGKKVMAVVRFDTNGSLDDYATVEYGGDAYGHGVALQPDGKVVIAGKAYYPDTGADFAVVRLNTELTLDASVNGDWIDHRDFGDQGYDCAYEVALRSDGSIVIAGTAAFNGKSVFGIMVYTSSGPALSIGVSDFADHAYGYGLALQPDGKAVVSGRSSSFGGSIAVARFSTLSNLDDTFSGDGMTIFRPMSKELSGGLDVVVQHDGKIVVAGYVEVSGVGQLALARFLTNGSEDLVPFSTPPFYGYTAVGFFPGYEAVGNAVCLQPDGKILVAGHSGSDFGQAAVVARFKGGERLIFVDGFENGSSAVWSSSSQ